MQLPKISSNILMAAGLIVVLLFSIADMLMLLSYSGQTTTFLMFLNQKTDMINHSDNETYKAQVAGYLAYLDNRINFTSQQANTASEGCLSRVKSLEESNKNLQNSVILMNRTIDNLTIYIMKINDTYQALGMRTANNITEYYLNNTYVPEEKINVTPVDNRTCKQKIIDLHGLGPMFDIVYCCESRAYGFADECCACYR
jgi:hypothetical protein